MTDDLMPQIILAVVLILILLLAFFLIIRKLELLSRFLWKLEQMLLNEAGSSSRPRPGAASIGKDLANPFKTDESVSNELLADIPNLEKRLEGEERKGEND